MLKLWYVCDGGVEEYSGQSPDWESSFIACASSPEKAIVNVIYYRRGQLDSVDIIYNDRAITVIT